MARVIGRDTPPTPRKRRWTRIKDEEMPEPILISDDDTDHLRKSPGKRAAPYIVPLAKGQRKPPSISVPREAIGKKSSRNNE